jgi:thiamine-phosphate pyrophosphorylase
MAVKENFSNIECDAASADAPTSTAALWRILDAAANRASEGLRVVEDYTRLALDDAHLSGQLKRLRHDLAAALALLPASQRMAARDTAGDVGTTLKTEAELVRGDLATVVLAGWKRTQQGLRTLEEYGKLVDARFAQACETLRYQTYTLERALDITRTSRERMQQARLYVLLSGGDSIEDFTQTATTLVTAGAHVLQLRDKQLADRELLARARLLRKITRDSETLLIVNDRPDVAVLSQADGVHVGQEELSVKDVRAIVGTNLLIGVSTHSIEQARAAVLDGANYLGLGPMFPSTTKQFAAFPGLEFAAAVAREITLPAFAIGGITLGNLSQVQAVGISRVAIGAAITEAAEQGEVVKRFLGELEE